LLTDDGDLRETLYMVHEAWMMAIITKTMMQPITQYKLIVVKLEFQPRPETSSGSSESASIRLRTVPNSCVHDDCHSRVDVDHLMVHVDDHL
jgi:hypothetical protein